MTPALWATLGGIVVAALGLIGAALNRRASPYEAIVTRLKDVEARLDRAEKRERDHHAALRIHAAWDSRVLAALSPEIAHGLGEIPPLYPDEIGH